MRQGKAITAEQFVRAWQDSSTQKEVASKLGISHQSVANRATRLRNRGVPLKIYQPRSAFDISRLIEICEAQGG